MGYATGAATGVNDLLLAIRNFAAAEGWTEDAYGARSDATAGNCLNIHKNDVYGSFFSNTTAGSGNDPGNYMGVYQYPSYSSGDGNMTQANDGAYTNTNGFYTSGFVAHYLFGGPTYIHVVVEVFSGTFKHFGLGVLNKLGAVTTGVYNYGSRLNYSDLYRNSWGSGYHIFPLQNISSSGSPDNGTVVRADCDDVTYRYSLAKNYGASYPLYVGLQSTNSPAYLPAHQMGISSLTGRTVLIPIQVVTNRGTYSSPIGYVPDIRLVRLDNYNPGDSITIAGDIWRVFPYIRKNGLATEVNSGVLGYAYLQRP